MMCMSSSTMSLSACAQSKAAVSHVSPCSSQCVVSGPRLTPTPTSGRLVRGLAMDKEPVPFHRSLASSPAPRQRATCIQRKAAAAEAIPPTDAGPGTATPSDIDAHKPDTVARTASSSTRSSIPGSAWVDAIPAERLKDLRRAGNAVQHSIKVGAHQQNPARYINGRSWLCYVAVTSGADQPWGHVRQPGWSTLLLRQTPPHANSETRLFCGQTCRPEMQQVSAAPAAA